MKTSTNELKKHPHVLKLTDTELLIVERALYRDGQDDTEYYVWDQLDNLVIDAGLTSTR